MSVKSQLKKTIKPKEFTFAPKIQIKNTELGVYFEELLRGYVHRLNNMLAVIQGFSRLIMMDEDLDGDTQENLKHMHESSINASKFGEQILQASGVSNIHLHKVDISSYLNMIKSSLEQPLIENSVKYKINIPENCPHVKSDTSNLKIILIELLKNAAENAAEVDGEVNLSLYKPHSLNSLNILNSKDNDNVNILISNSGCELNKKELESIFKPFYTRKKRNQAGIGLTIVSILAQQIGIDIKVSSSDSLTVFWLSIPLHK